MVAPAWVGFRAAVVFEQEHAQAVVQGRRQHGRGAGRGRLGDDGSDGDADQDDGEEQTLHENDYTHGTGGACPIAAVRAR